MQVSPAYGRDYKSKAAIVADLKAGKDFLIANHHDPKDGKPINLPQMKADGITGLTVRYAHNRKVCVINLIKEAS